MHTALPATSRSKVHCLQLHAHIVGPTSSQHAHIGVHVFFLTTFLKVQLLDNIMLSTIVHQLSTDTST